MTICVQPESGKATTSSARYVYTFSLLHVCIPQEILCIIAYYFSTHAGDLKYIWQDVPKIIDTPRIHNHKDARCKEMYTPDRIKEEHPTYNTMSCEQTFVWLSRFKKVVRAMEKKNITISTSTEW